MFRAVVHRAYFIHTVIHEATKNVPMLVITFYWESLYSGRKNTQALGFGHQRVSTTTQNDQLLEESFVHRVIDGVIETANTLIYICLCILHNSMLNFIITMLT